jgi:ketosteroid isomerase-like protein
MDEKKAIEEMNARFYRAIESGDIEQVDEVCAHEEWVKCVHPGWEIISGWSRVRESWRRIFAGGQKMRISASDVSVHVFGDLAWLTCTENITVFYDSSFDSTQAAATNLFLRREDQWVLVHHHASPIPVILPDSATDTVQ